MTKRLIAFLMVLMLAISVASMALGDGWDMVYPVGMGIGGERGGCQDPGYHIGSGGKIEGCQASVCSYACLN